MISLWSIFKVFFKIGAFTIGGGYMMVPAIEAEIRKKKWINEEELPDMVALSQSAPGLLTVNMAIFTGYRLRGVPGSIVATLGAVVAPFVAILLIAMFFSSFRSNRLVEAVFCGVRPVAVAIIAGYAFKLIRKQGRWWQWMLTLVSMLLITILKVSPIYILLVVIVFSAAITGYSSGRIGK